MFYADRTNFYLQYLADIRPPRLLQTLPMAAGSAFDAYVKSYLSERLFGKKPEFELQTIFETQVEPQNRDKAFIMGKYLFECYKTSGALVDLIVVLEKATHEPRFEFSVDGTICMNGNHEGISFTGKPDMFVITDIAIIHDWKVNGMYANTAKSPEAGYIIARDGWVGKQSRSHMKAHKEAVVDYTKGIGINVAASMDKISSVWATQLCIYGWLLGCETDFVASVDQLVGKPGNGFPEVRVASFRNMIPLSYQQEVYEKAQNMMRIIKSGHIFDDLPLEESQQKCANLNRFYELHESDDPNDLWIANLLRSER